MSLFNVAPARGFGFQQYINFGKHKGKTYYDVANSGDYQYLKWCLKSNQASAKDPRSFFISDTCMPHIRSSLLTENVAITPWTKQVSEEDHDGRCICVYTAQDMKEEDKTFQGPDIEMKRCPRCKTIKTYLLFDLGDHDMCRKCYMMKHNNIEEQVPHIERRTTASKTYPYRPPIHKPEYVAHYDADKVFQKKF